MPVIAFSRSGFEGELVTVEVDIRRGIPGVDIVGLPDGAVREAKERIRAAIRNSGYAFPADRVLINLAPASLRKEGSSFDLPIAMAILLASNQAHSASADPVLVIGELELSGVVRPVAGVLSAVSRAVDSGVGSFIVPGGNIEEAASLRRGRPLGVSSLSECVEAFLAAGNPVGQDPAPRRASDPETGAERGDFPVLDREWRLNALGRFFSVNWPPKMARALIVAAAGGHHVLLAGPPGGGKTLAASRFAWLLPDLSRRDAVEATRIHSLAGILPEGSGLLFRPPFRSPHHSASQEGMVGGGRILKPGEISLAHRGVLFLDEAPEFDRDILQALREPIEDGRITLSRAGGQARFPADFQLLLAANPCPCGNLGRRGAACLCSLQEVERYWRRLGGALLDRIDIRVPVMPVSPEMLFAPAGGGGEESVEGLSRAIRSQARRFEGLPFSRNVRIPPEILPGLCPLDGAARHALEEACRRRCLSSRAGHSVCRVARTVADVNGHRDIAEIDVEEALSLRGLDSGDGSEWFA
jgi:magnesium chelatase family protein